ncbi:MAG: helix-turn-helix transcriptional regulator [Deltaproteobacteria bacterium]|nr:helix-turn-helix transcriptional regulator [Deltaproteobacteria bacterium]MBK8719783.1 helix-turn-helix transcriptional regulator [Deltaproteobacteria bacterium]MBP7285241.1 helix-turn-helix transcriptional regulator [Nannocystaceae bacterium]
MSAPLVARPLADVRVLLVSLEVSEGLALAAVLAAAGANVVVTRSVQSARDAVASHPGAFSAALLDFAVPSPERVDLAASLRQRRRPCLHALFGDVRRARSLRDALRCGAIELIDREGNAASMVRAVARVVEASENLRTRCEQLGELRDEVTEREARTELPRAEPDPIAQAAREGRLSARELAVLRYMMAGYRYVDIAQAMGIAKTTVKMHTRNLRRKLGASTRWDVQRRLLAA